MEDHTEAERLYGPWRARTPGDAVALLDGYPGLWWIAGGWAIEGFTGVSRPHGDLDLSISRSDVGLLRKHLRGRLDVWEADRGALRPMVDAADDRPSATCGNLWLRRSGADPWEYDVILASTTDGDWTYKRDSRIRRRLDSVLWSTGGVRYLRPEVQLLYKASGLRDKDEQDFASCLSLMGGRDRAWLSEALEAAHPGHPWISRLEVARAAADP